MHEATSQKPLVHRADSLDVLELTVRTHNALRRTDIGTVGQVLDAYRAGSLMAVRNFGEKAFAEVERGLDSVTIVDGDVYEEGTVASGTNEPKRVVVKEVSGFPEDQVIQILQSLVTGQIRSGLLHPDVVFNGEKLSEIARSTTYMGSLFYDLAKILTGPPTVFEELEAVLSGLSDRAVSIVRLRHGFSAKTLIAVGERFGVTRERIRQIEQQAVRQIQSKMNAMPLLRIASALEFANDESMQLFYETWARMITESGLRGDWRQEATLAYDPLEMMIAVCRATNWGGGRLRCSACLQCMLELREQGKTTVPARAMRSAQSLTPEARKLVYRHLRHSGAVSVEWSIAEGALDCSTTNLKDALLDDGFDSVDDDWLLHPDFTAESAGAHDVFHNAMMKLSTFCGPVTIEDIYFGMEHTLSRVQYPVPPIAILEKILEAGGYTLEDGLWYWDGVESTELNRAETLIFDTIRVNGGVAHHSQLAAAILAAGLSYASVAGTLNRSPLFTRIEHGLYKLRSTEPAHKDISRARKTSEEVSVDLETEYGFDGRIMVAANLSSFSIGHGVVSSAHLPTIAGIWHWDSLDQVRHNVEVMDDQIRGLRLAFVECACGVGDRVRLVFNVDTREVKVARVENVE